MAEKAIQVTTRFNRNGENTYLDRNMGTNDSMLIYRMIELHFFTGTFFVTGKAKSTRGYSCMHIFVSDKGFVKVYPMIFASKFPEALRVFAKDVGAPEILVADPHHFNESKEVKCVCKTNGTTLRLLGQNNQWENVLNYMWGL